MNAIVKKVTYEIPGTKPGEKFTDEKTVIVVTGSPSLAAVPVAFRALDVEKDAEGKLVKNDVLLFGSSRSGQVVPTPDGFQIDVPENLELDGKDYELKDIATKQVIASGKIFKVPVVATEINDQASADAKTKTKKEKTI